MGRWGIRVGASRPYDSGKFNEETRPIRISISEIDYVLKCAQNGFYRLPLYQSSVTAGFPSPAEDEIDQELDLNELLIKHPSATFFVRVSGDSMIKAGIHHNDILIVDRSLEPKPSKIVIASLNGELTVKRLHRENGKIFLLAENDAFPPIEINAEIDFRIWGVVTNVIHTV